MKKDERKGIINSQAIWRLYALVAKRTHVNLIQKIAKFLVSNIQSNRTRICVKTYV